MNGWWERFLDREDERFKRDVRRDIIRIYDIPPELIGASRWAGGFWWRVRRSLRGWS